MISRRLYRSLQSLVLVLLGLFLFNRLIDGSLFWYINARFLPLTMIGAVGLVVLARTLLAELQAADAPAAHSHVRPSLAGLVLLGIPVLFGLLVPVHPLGASDIANRGLNAVAPKPAGGTDAQLQLAPGDRNLLDWLRAFNQTADPGQYAGQPSTLIGFVYHDPRLPAGQFLLARFMLTCCVADAAAIGVIVEWPQAAELPTNGWVQISGTVQVGEFGGVQIPLIEAGRVEAVPEPAQPYLYN